MGSRAPDDAPVPHHSRHRQRSPGRLHRLRIHPGRGDVRQSAPRARSPPLALRGSRRSEKGAHGGVRHSPLHSRIAVPPRGGSDAPWKGGDAPRRGGFRSRSALQSSRLGLHRRRPPLAEPARSHARARGVVDPSKEAQVCGGVARDGGPGCRHARTSYVRDGGDGGRTQGRGAPAADRESGRGGGGVPKLAAIAARGIRYRPRTHRRQRLCAARGARTAAWASRWR
mmetsp:Transcript_17501/g.57252  ORF Transcript_17501/g.57252 Transcript_17501/m.57252 type:complete len:227 (+) Transcript_17501:1367-2047(+)